MSSSPVRDRLLARSHLFERVARELDREVEALARLAAATLARGGTLLFCGNGGSAADAQHLAAEYVVRLGREREALAALALSADSAILTAAANDYGFDRVFARQVEAVGRRGDLLFLHSTSGESENLVVAARAARAKGIATAGLLAGGGGRLRAEVDECLIVPTDDAKLAQEVHLALGHEICVTVEAVLLGRPAEDPANERPPAAGPSAEADPDTTTTTGRGAQTRETTTT